MTEVKAAQYESEKSYRTKLQELTKKNAETVEVLQVVWHVDFVLKFNAVSQGFLVTESRLWNWYKHGGFLNMVDFQLGVYWQEKVEINQNISEKKIKT